MSIKRLLGRAPEAAAVATLAALCAGAWHLQAAADPLADLKAAAAALDSKNYQTTLTLAGGLVQRLPNLADYAAWLAASAQFGLRNYAAAVAALDPVWKQSPASPNLSNAYLLAAQALLLNGAPKDAIDILRKNYAGLPQPQTDLLLAQAFLASSDQVSAAIYNQRVYFNYPASAGAAIAGGELSKLRTALGANYPPALPDAMLTRAHKLVQAGQFKAARQELAEMIPQLGGADRDLARVRLGVADYEANETAAAHRELSELDSLSPAADAERLYYLVQCDRRLNNLEESDQHLDRLARLYPYSQWRLESLMVAANRFLITNQPDAYEPLYRACYETFPKDPEAPNCHWHVVWSHYIRRRADAADMLRAHLRLFPAAETASTALYFLGRLAEEANDRSAAATYYGEVAGQYPNQYYAILSRERLAKIGAGAASAAVNEFLHSIAFTERARTKNFNPGPSAAARMERAKLLQQAGLNDWAEQELRYAARTASNNTATDDQPYFLAMQLGSLISSKPDQAMRAIKAYAGGYLFLPVESAPKQFWTLAFPLPFRTDLETFAKQNGLDPFLVAGLIRQESEFNPKAVSPAGARGLTQIEPSTGRDLSRRLKVTTYSAAALFQPRMNLQLGTYYLKTLLGSVGGREDAALAAYDAGLTHARAWLTWGDFREPAEFIETIPFTETRAYVEGVLRNAEMYRRVYGAEANPSKGVERAASH